jgi:hypothetical protein
MANSLPPLSHLDCVPLLPPPFLFLHLILSLDAVSAHWLARCSLRGFLCSCWWLLWAI